jgi:anaerobic magnesium-protoporphyrin IX monomethyl ester cyclase
VKILLVTQHANPRFTPLALLYLKAALVAQGVADAAEVTIAEFGPDDGEEAIAATLVAAEPDVVGLSCYVWNIAVLREVSRRVRLACPEVKIVMGGPEVGPVAARVLGRTRSVDVIVRSEGEGPICELVRCWRADGRLEDVAGITWRAGDRITENADAAIVRDLNQVASPHFANFIDHTGRVICLETQRGCVFTCSFCFYNKDYSIRNRRFDLDRVQDELRFWLDEDVHEIYLMDPVFNLNAARAKEICRFVIRHNHRHIPFHTEVWAEFIDDEMAALFAEANFTFVEVGLQTSDHAVLDLVERRFKRQEFINGLGHLNAHGIPYELQLIAGLPGETLDTLRASLDFAASFAPPHLSVFDLMILPGTELSRKADSMGIEFDPEPPYEIRSHPTMPAGDMAHARDLSLMAGRLWRLQTMRLLARATGGGYAALVEDWLRWRGGTSTTDETRALLPAFVERWCALRPLDARFFMASATVETRPQGP